MGCSGGPRARPDGGDGDAREDALDALFRELDEEPAAWLAERARAKRAGAGRVVMGIGVVLIGVGLLAIPFLGDPRTFLPLFLTVNVAAVACVIAGLLLLPEKPEPFGQPNP